MMLVSQMAAPLASSTLAFWVKLDTSTMPTTRRTAASALATVIRPMSTLVRLWSHGRSRSMRPGSPMIEHGQQDDEEDEEEPGGVAVAQLVRAASPGGSPWRRRRAPWATGARRRRALPGPRSAARG